MCSPLLDRYPPATNPSSCSPVAPQVSTPLDHPGSLSISTAFHPALSIDDTDPDVVLVSADGVHFYAHQHRLLAVSMNHMGNLLPSPGAVTTPPLLTVHVPHPAEVVNVVLHTMYGLSCAQYLPTLEVVEAAVDSLSLLYGVSVPALAAPGAPLFQLILSFAPFRPLDAYALAAHYQLEDLAVTISSHLLAYNLARLPDSTAQRMGPIYLKRLFLLHQSRVAALRTILFKPPAAHLPVLGCGEESQRMLTRAWALAVAQLVWDVLPSKSYPRCVSLVTETQDLFCRCIYECPASVARAYRRVDVVHALRGCVAAPSAGGGVRMVRGEGELILLSIVCAKTHDESREQSNGCVNLHRSWLSRSQGRRPSTMPPVQFPPTCIAMSGHAGAML